MKPEIYKEDPLLSSTSHFPNTSQIQGDACRPSLIRMSNYSSPPLMLLSSISALANDPHFLECWNIRPIRLWGGMKEMMAGFQEDRNRL